MAIDWGEVMFHTSGRRNHRNAIIALAFLAAITVAGYYLAPSDDAQGRALQSTTATTPVTNTISNGPDICQSYIGDDSIISCNEAVRIASEKYAGYVGSVDNSKPEGSEVFFWNVHMQLSEPIEHRGVLIEGIIDVIVDKETGDARIYRYRSA